MAKSQIFICYRRQDSEDIAGRLYERLIADLGEDGVFMDDDIPLGVDFRDHIRAELDKSDFLLALIGPSWLEVLRQRMKDPRDFLRVELETAAAMRIPIAPILLKDVAHPRQEELPPGFSLRDKLPYYHSRRLRSGAYFSADYQDLLRAIRKARKADRMNLPQPAPVVEQRSRDPRESRRKAPGVAQQAGFIAGTPFREPLKSGGEGPEMVVVPAGAFQMGSPGGEKGRYSDEGPVHRVTVAAFALARTQ